MSNRNQNDVARAIEYAFFSPNEHDRNLEPANTVDGLFAIARAINRLADVLEESKEDMPAPPRHWKQLGEKP